MSKVFAFGGGNVRFAYYKSLDDAESLLAELKTVDHFAPKEMLNVIDNYILHEQILQKFRPVSLYCCARLYTLEVEEGFSQKPS